jgi:CCT motif
MPKERLKPDNEFPQQICVQQPEYQLPYYKGESAVDEYNHLIAKFYHFHNTRRDDIENYDQNYCTINQHYVSNLYNHEFVAPAPIQKSNGFDFNRAHNVYQHFNFDNQVSNPQELFEYNVATRPLTKNNSRQHKQLEATPSNSPKGSIQTVKRIGKYTVEERKARIARYKAKQKNYAKKVRYHVRKVAADNSPRIKGKFVTMETWRKYKRVVSS